MTSQRALRILRIICWTGAVADAVWTAALIYPPLYGQLTRTPLTDPDLSLRLAMGIGASLMAGWTLLLAWAAADPVHRSAVMLLTAFPVLTGLVIVSLIGFINGNTPVWIPCKSIILFIAMLAGFFLAKPTEANHDIKN